MENLKAALTALIESWKSYLIVGGACLVAGVVIGVWL
jgi:hypothetical protein